MPAPKGHKYAIGNKGGRPPVFSTAKALAKKVDEYFLYIHGEKKKKKVKVTDPKSGKVSLTEVEVWLRPWEYASITGLTLYLGFSHRQSLDDYEKKEMFSDIIARARTRVAFHYEQRLNQQFSQGAIFALKNMDGWKDKTEVESTNKNLNYNAEPLTVEKLRELEELKKREF